MLVWGLVLVFVIGARGLVLVAGWCLVGAWCLVGVRAGAGGCGCVLVGRERGLVCAGRVDKWKGREWEPVSVGSLSLSFSSFVERMTGLEPAASTLGVWRSSC